MFPRAMITVLATSALLGGCMVAPEHTAQHKPAELSLARRLQLGYEAAQAWVGSGTTSAERRHAADAEAYFLRMEVVSDGIDACLSPAFNETLANDIAAQLHDGNLYNALAALWDEDYSDAQLAEIHRVAMAGGSPAEVNPVLFQNLAAPTAASIKAAPSVAARRVFAENPPAFLAYVKTWVQKHPAACTKPRTALQWQNAIRYEPLYNRSSW